MNTEQFEVFFRKLIKRCVFSRDYATSKDKNTIAVSDGQADNTELSDDDLSAAAGGIYINGDVNLNENK